MGKTIADIEVAGLKPHPRNAELYRQRDQREIEDLAQDMDANGQTEPVEVTPDLTIISGHGRCEAAKRLGWKTIRCWVRGDLADIGPHAVEIRLIEANLHRRQLSRLDLVRSYRRVKSLAEGKGRYDATRETRGDLRDQVAKQFGVSGRTLDRWLQLLDMPMRIQEAVDQGALKLTDAVRMAALDRPSQEQIAAELRDGTPVKEILARYVAKTPVAEFCAGRALDRLISALTRAQEELAPCIDQLRRIGFSGELEGLRGGQQLLQALVSRIKRNKREHNAKAVG